MTDRVKRRSVIVFAIVLALLSGFILFGTKPFRIVSSAMEPTLNCAKPNIGCLGGNDDRVLVCRLCSHFGSPSRGDIVAFATPPAAASACGEGGTFIKRIVGLPGETVKEDDKGFIWIRGPAAPTWTKLNEPYVSAQARKLDSAHWHKQWSVPSGAYFVIGDNRSESCDSRQWGSVPQADAIGPVVFRYWPLSRLGFP